MKRITCIWTLAVVCALLTGVMFTSGCTEAPQGTENDTGMDGNVTPGTEDAGTGATMISEDNIEDIAGIKWQWIELNGTMPSDKLQVSDPENYYLVFTEDGAYYFRADCNTGSGNYTLEGEDLTLHPGVMTLIACTEGSLDSQYLSSLSNVTSAAIEDRQLALYTEEQESTMHFDNAGNFEQGNA